ncbi:MAG: hypothetical protein HY291_13170 [Planctomycetes bacterium]|nr:hypothetical protein [Planctomycetota bacterium]
MSAIRIRKHLDSATLHLPQLRPLIGKNVEITVKERRQRAERARKPITLKPVPAWMPPCKTPRQCMLEQGKKPMTIADMRGGWPKDELNDGFEEALKEWRRQEVDEEIKNRKMRRRRS